MKSENERVSPSKRPKASRSERRKKTRIQDVARSAGVSLSTVSAVINNVDIVKDETRQRVLAAIKRLDYHPDLYASNLARRRTKIFGLIVSDVVNPFFAEAAWEIEQYARSRDYEIALAATGFSAQRLRDSVRQMLAMRVAGIAVLTSESDPVASKLLRSRELPCIFLDVGEVSRTVSNLRVDTRAGILEAVQHLVGLGHKSILMVDNSPESALAQELLTHRLRTDGFTAAIREFRRGGVCGHVVDYSGTAAAAGAEAIRQAIGKIDFSAVIAINDIVAIGVCRGILDCGLSVPENISVVGFDNTYLCKYLNPTLTTVDIPRNSMARMVIDRLIAQTERDEPGRELLLESRLVVRASTAPPRNGESR